MTRIPCQQWQLDEMSDGGETWRFNCRCIIMMHVMTQTAYSIEKM